MPAAAIPLLYGATAIGSGIASYRSAKKAGKLSPVEEEAQRTQQGASNALTDQGRMLTNYGMPQLQQASRYYSTIAGGNRAAIQQTLAPDVANINDTYGGTQRTLARFLKGPDRDYQLGELARQRAGAIGSLFTGARQRGVESLVNLGQYGVSQGAAAYGGAAGVAGNLASMGQSNRQYATQLQRDAGAGTANLVFQLLKLYAQQRGSSSSGGR